MKKYQTIKDLGKMLLDEDLAFVFRHLCDGYQIVLYVNGYEILATECSETLGHEDDLIEVTWGDKCSMVSILTANQTLELILGLLDE